MKSAAVTSIVFAAIAGATAESMIPVVTTQARSLLEIVWEELPFPKGDSKHFARASEGATVDGVDYDTKYVVIQRGGDKVGDNTFGLMVDKDGKGLEKDGKPFVSVGNDFSSLLPNGDKVTMISHFESPEPSVVYFTKMTQDIKTGKLTVLSTEPMDWSEYGGIWVPCAGSVTPWKSHLGSEEYEPDAKVLADFVKTNATGTNWLEERLVDWVHMYLGIPETATNEEVAKKWFPYNYGYPWEVTLDKNGDLKSKRKIMSAGRLAIELAYVMPDQKTVYITDDGTNVMLGIYKLSLAGDMSCGTTWAAQMKQTSSEGGGAFDVKWIQVGEEACIDEIRAKATTTTFYDLFDVAEPNKDGKCPEGYKSINAGHDAGLRECLKLKEGMQKYAARFEFRRTAAYLGATTEFSKWEGITYDTKRNRIYTALSQVREGMEDFKKKGEADDEFDVGGRNDIKLEYNPCGCEKNTDEFNSCDKESIAGPDNVAYVPGHDGLIIGEDTDEHQNNAMWYHNFKDGTTTRFLTTPYGAETTSPYWYPNINGWSYLMAVVQHPYVESDQDKKDEPKATGLNSYAGYVGPFKAHPESVDMAKEADGPILWNGFPAMPADMGIKPKSVHKGRRPRGPRRKRDRRGRRPRRKGSE